jgi:C1A family cysteine protease
MIRMVAGALFSVLALLGSAQAGYPAYPNNQHLKGYLNLPYAELQEPFEFWYTKNDSTAVSRTDWYNGLDVTINRPDIGAFGTTYKFSYTTVAVDDAFTCFTVPGESDYPVVPDQMLPDLTGFVSRGFVNLNGKSVQMLFNQYSEEGRTNTYKFYFNVVDGSYVPLQYSMLGYDTLLGSHYDRYDVIYDVADEVVDSSVFDLQDGYTCRSFPGPGASVEKRIAMRPAHHVINNDAHKAFDTAFQQFKQQFNKNYPTTEEERSRVYKYMQNVRYIHSKNRAALGFTMAVNHLADTDYKERNYKLGLKHVQDGRAPNAKRYDAQSDPEITIPDTWDWRIQGAVTQVKDQAVCGSCWSFGTTGTLEGSYFLKTGDLRRLSQQNLMDCSWTLGNDGCDGGEDWRSYEWIMHNGGLEPESSYGPYLGQNGKCHFNSSKAILQIESYAFVKGEDVNTLKKALITQGPISIGIDASQTSLSFYHRGVYYDPKCGNTVNDLDHAVLLVGYGTTNGEPYWLVKNSWSTYWGNLGYVTMAVKDNNCGVMTQPSYATLA